MQYEQYQPFTSCIQKTIKKLVFIGFLSLEHTRVCDQLIVEDELDVLGPIF